MRRASHAGSWYSATAAELEPELQGWLRDAGTANDGDSDGGGAGGGARGRRRTRAIVAPHAGYSYSGPTAAHAYRRMDHHALRGVRRVFVLGPSHHLYLDECCALPDPACLQYDTPLGALDLDVGVLTSLGRTGEFAHLSRAEDEAEHAIELQLPFIAQALRRARRRGVASAAAVRIVPIVVGALSPAAEKRFGAMLAPYARDPASFFVISSDFCHWGSDFDYQPVPPPPPLPLHSESLASRGSWGPECGEELHAFIARLDGEGMELLRRRDTGGWSRYLERSGNTICGRHAISILMHAMDCVDNAVAAAAACHGGGRTGSDKWEVRWLAYKQSVRAQRMTDSSVSYASGVVESCGA